MCKKNFIALLALLLVIVAIPAFSLAWLALDQNTIVTNISGRLVVEYFHCGCGSEDDPFVITRPIHYYHMVEFFQRLTNLPVVVYGEEDRTVVKFGTEYLYFQIGCPEAQLYDPSLRPETDENTVYYVFDYDSFGILNVETVNGVTRGQKSTSLNMAYYGGELAMMPVGSSEIPFVGQLDGKGVTVNNLNVTTTTTVDVYTYDENGVPSVSPTSTTRHTCDVGVFGFVGYGGVAHGDETNTVLPTSIKNVYYDNLKIDLSGLSASAITSVVDGQTHTNTTAIHNGETCYAGYIAGHIVLTSTVDNVYVNNATFTGGSGAEIGYGYFGCVENSGGEPIETLGSEVTTLRAKGDDAGFGGSIDMKKLHGRLLEIWSNGTNGADEPDDYATEEIIRIDKDGNVTGPTVTASEPMTFPTERSGQTSVTARYRYYSTLKAGKYFYFNRTDMESSGYNFMCLYGEGSRYPKTVITYTELDDYTEAWFIKDGNDYLAVSGTTLTSVTDQSLAAKWMFDASGHLYTVIETASSFDEYYLNRTGTASVGLSDTASSVWHISEDGGDAEGYYSSMYVTYNDTDYYLSYEEGGWMITPYDSYYRISDGSGHFLNGDTSSVSSVSSAAASVKWHLSDPSGSSTTIFTYINGTVWYLNGEGSLTMSSSSPTTWLKDGDRFYVNVQGIRHDLVYDPDGDTWLVLASSGKKLTDGNGHYLSADSSGVKDDTLSGSAAWQFSADSGDTQIFTIINGARSYLTYDNGLALTSSPVTWTRSGSAFYLTSGGKDYYLAYENGWTAIPLVYYLIHDGNGNYLRVTGANTFANGDEGNATHFYFSNGNGASSSGTVYCTVGGDPYYLSNSNGTLSTADSANAATWTNDGSGAMRPQGTSYELGYDSGWKLIDTTSYWTIATTGGTYLNVNGTNLTTSGSPTRWNRDNNGRYSVTVNGQTYYLRVNVTTGCNTEYSLQLSTTNSNNQWTYSNNRLSVSANNSTRYLRLNGSTWEQTESQNNAASVNVVQHNDSGAAFVTEQSDTEPSVGVTDHSSTGTDITVDGPSDEDLTHEKTVYQTVTKDVETERGGYQTYFPLRIPVSSDADYDANDPYKASNKNTGYIISAARIEDTNSAAFQKIMGDIRISYFPISKINGSYSTGNTLSVSRIAQNGNYLTLVKDENDNWTIGNTTDQDSAVFWKYSNSKLTATVGSDTYYLTYNSGLAISKVSGVDWTFSNNNRLAYNNNYIKYANGAWTATTGTQNLTLTLGALGTIYTVRDGGRTELTGTLKTEAYEQAAFQLAQSLAGSSSVYGLHFMNALISKDYLVTADYVNLFGQEYTDGYELPEDSIDFNVIERGTINFFAGEYFTNNTAFFSLHQVFRYKSGDPEVLAGTKKVNDIKDIKEIAEVYKHATLGDQTNYIFKFSDNTYLNADGTYTGVRTLDPAYSATPAFKTSWITAPGSAITSEGNRLFYFEIPCNPGEYCLGSVSGETGAYLVYLDIATNGGDSIASAISSEGNDVVDSFKVEFRDKPDVMDHTVLQFSITAPEVADPSDFSVTVSFDASDTASPHTSGLYTITVVNLTGSADPLNLYVYLCDDDFNLTTAFPYAYQVVYTNSDHQNVILSTAYGDSLQVMAGFLIPSSGDATEMIYY